VTQAEEVGQSAGAARWFFETSQAMLEQVFGLLCGGSSVSFYFSRYLHVRTDDEAARQEMFDELTENGELILGYPTQGAAELEIAIVNGPSELTECLMFHSEGALAVWGQWPPRASDGEEAITVDLVDADGALRRHPH
jgi:hypothetical protein